MKIVYADPGDKLDYEWEFASDLPTGDTIDAATVVASDPDVTITDVDRDGTRVVAWAEGGTVNTTVELVCTVTTTEGRRFVRRTSLIVQYR